MRIITIAFCLIMLSGCSLFQSKDDDRDKWSAEKLYLSARSALDSGNYEKAIELYEKLEVRFPFGLYVRQSILDLAYTHYLSNDPDAAIRTTERFIQLYPQNKHVDYAYYLKGLTNFNRGKSFVARFLPIDEAQRDPGSSMLAFQDFNELVQRYPTSRYAADAKLRMTHLRNVLAEHEINVAQYYMRQGGFVAAANRARLVVEKYSRTPSISDALVIMAKAYRAMELDDLYEDTLRVFELNYPDDPRILDLKQLTLY